METTAREGTSTVPIATARMTANTSNPKSKHKPKRNRNSDEGRGSREAVDGFSSLGVCSCTVKAIAILGTLLRGPAVLSRHPADEFGDGFETFHKPGTRTNNQPIINNENAVFADSFDSFPAFALLDLLGPHTAGTSRPGNQDQVRISADDILGRNDPLTAMDVRRKREDIDSAGQLHALRFPSTSRNHRLGPFFEIDSRSPSSLPRARLYGFDACLHPGNQLLGLNFTAHHFADQQNAIQHAGKRDRIQQENVKVEIHKPRHNIPLKV